MNNKTTTKQRRKDLPPFKVYASKEEASLIISLAKTAGMSVSVYLRTVGMGTIPTSKIDMEQAREIVRVGKDLSRLGGLLKALLTNDERFAGTYGLALQRATMGLVEDLSVTNEILKQKIQSLFPK